MNESIPLSGKLYLLGIHPEKGGIISSAYTAMDYILLGALFLELWMNKNISFENSRVVVLHSKSDNSLHNFLLRKFKKNSKLLKISRWMNKLYFSQKYIRREIQQDLEKRHIIRMEKKRFLIFRWKKPVLVNKQPVYKLVSEVENKLFSGSGTVEEIMLLSMIKPAGLLKRIFPDSATRKLAKGKLRQLSADNEVSLAVANAIAASKAVAASVAATVAVSAATHSS